MRYLAGFSGGLVVAILLFAFQEYLISGERAVTPEPSSRIFLPVVKTSRPVETKPYEPVEPPQKPEALEHPLAAMHEPAAPVQPELPPLLNLHGFDGPGNGPFIAWGGGGVPDRDAAVKFPVEPQYPVEALRNGLEGEVEIEFTILPSGRVTDLAIVRANPPGVFERSALRALQRWEFLPKMENGKPVAMRARQVIEFRLPE